MEAAMGQLSLGFQQLSQVLRAVAVQSEISDLRCRIRPNSKFLQPVFLKPAEIPLIVAARASLS